jgi:hypothetical protein
MTHQRSKKYAIALAGVAVALALGSATTAHADALDDLAGEFTTASGAGPIAGLVNQSLKLRSMGIRPTNGEMAAVQDAMKYRPNQTPLIAALKDMVGGQTHRLKQAQASQQQQQFTVGINQYDPTNPGGVSFGPGGVNLGGGAWQIGGQPGTSVGPPG